MTHSMFNLQEQIEALEHQCYELERKLPQFVMAKELTWEHEARRQLYFARCAMVEARKNLNRNENKDT